MISLAIGCIIVSKAIQKPPVPLVTFHAISGGLDIFREKKAIGGLVFDSAIGSVNRNVQVAVFDLEKRFASFVYAVGIFDESGIGESRESRYTIKLDGETVKDESITKDLKPVLRVIDVRGKRSLRIACGIGVAFGEPTLSYQVVSQPKPSKIEAAPSSDTVVVLEDKLIKLRWPKISDSNKYAVTLVLTAPLASESKERVWSFTSGPLPELDIERQKLPAGRYSWFVWGLPGKARLQDATVGKEFEIPSQ